MTAVQVPVTFPEKTYSVLLGKLLRKPDAPGLQQAEGWWGLLSVPGRVPWGKEEVWKRKVIWSKWISQFSSVTESCPSLCNPMNCSTPGLPVHHLLPEFTKSHVHQVGDTIQPSHPLSSLSPPALNLSQHQGLFQGVSSSHQVAKVLEFQLQHQSFQWTPRADFL